MYISSIPCFTVCFALVRSRRRDIYIRLRVLFPAARIRCFLHPGIAPRPVSFDMLLSGVCIACFALVRSRSRRHKILPAACFSPPPAYIVFPMRRCRTAARYHICVAPRRIMSDGTGFGPSHTRTFAAREKFLCARPTRKFIFRPTVKLSAQRRTPAALPRVNVTRKTSLRASTAPLRHG